MKKNIKKLIAFFMMIAILMTPVSSVYAADINPQIISSLKHERILNIATTNGCGATQGMVIGRSHDSLFVAKINQKQNACVLYYFPNFNYSSVTSSNKHAVISVENAGHVNGMSIDDNYLYFTGTGSGAGDSLKTDNIIRISRTLIASLARQLWNGEITNAVIKESDYQKLEPMVQNPDPVERETKPYVPYNRVIENITCIDIDGVKKNNYFIINYQFPNTNFYRETMNRTAFTRAKIKKFNGVEFLYVSEATNKVFVIKNTLASTEGYTNPDICYSSKCGFFVPKFYKDKNSNGMQTKNVILWADIQGTPDGTYTRDGKSYNLYIPDKINLNPVNYQETLDGVTKPKYQKFELEGMDFDEDLNLYFSANVSYMDPESNGAENVENIAAPNGADSPNTVSSIGHDAVFRLVRTDKDSKGNSQDWTLACKPS